MALFTKLFWIILLLGIAINSFAKENKLLVLNYHDIVETESAASLDNMDVSIDHFEAQLAWLKANQFKIISVQDLIDAKEGKRPLPPKAILLTFDDGYQSFYTRVFPILKKQHIPATVALVGSWMPPYDSKDKPGKPLLTWEQVREISDSGLVEIASHSFDLHHGIQGNPQGSSQAAAVTRLYDTKLEQYETDSQYRERIRTTLLKSAESIFQHVGSRPRVMVWPYGEYNEITLEAAREAGMPITMGLVDGNNNLSDLSAMHRLILVENPKIDAFAKIVTSLRANQPLRVAHVDLDYIYDPDPVQTEHNLLLLLKRIEAMHINTVFLQAYADPDGDGNADALYFPNRHLPVRRDLFSRAAWQLKMVSRVKVYAWMPIMAYKGSIPESWYVKEWKDGKAQNASHIYTRLSPFNAEARQWVADLYEDLAKYCNFDGLLFHDDGILSDFEDASPEALNYTHQVWGLPDSFEQLHENASMRMQWAQHKTELINRFTDELRDRVRIYRPGIKTARNIYALPILKPFSEEWFAQSLPSFIAHYDYVAVEAMPLMEEAEQPDAWLTELVNAVNQHPQGLQKTLFELQTVNWKNQQKIAMPMFIDQVERLKKLGVQHIGYYPDNVYENQPVASDIAQHFSLPVLP